MASRYDDEIWELVPTQPGAPPARLEEFVRGLGQARRVLDLGCGDGRLSAALAADELTLADVSPVALERAARRLPRARTMELWPDAPLTVPDGSFELVLCAEVLEHVRDVQLLLSECRRVLVPGGRLAVTTPAYGRSTGAAILARGFERLFPPLSPHLRFFTARSLASALTELGFEPGTIRRRSGTLLAVANR